MCSVNLSMCWSKSLPVLFCMTFLYHSQCFCTGLCQGPRPIQCLYLCPSPCLVISMSISDIAPGCQQKLVAVKLPLVADDGHVREVVACERVPHITWQWVPLKKSWEDFSGFSGEVLDGPRTHECCPSPGQLLGQRAQSPPEDKSWLGSSS